MIIRPSSITSLKHISKQSADLFPLWIGLQEPHQWFDWNLTWMSICLQRKMIILRYLMVMLSSWPLGETFILKSSGQKPKATPTDIAPVITLNRWDTPGVDTLKEVIIKDMIEENYDRRSFLAGCWANVAFHFWGGVICYWEYDNYNYAGNTLWNITVRYQSMWPLNSQWMHVMLFIDEMIYIVDDISQFWELIG